ncbi:hypothetical protein M758_4G011500 [Ceratodon purpureus]|uniref:Uncharacterized protein n=1 Tax=Ceratodon purpureus TaxID=3225 RepID=A0A8T0I438_CERPU|nr:hypothetical protein KC19_4G012500 [Ceratodon purpureus]KAG0578300.1 hypothetical protein KC19_4G012700 [Ceratodon purpureus]KAG0578303.1 hypothetical protein KC19_4G012800 [Ceratodon purpureus]KAG0617742.1 hypothetical protein M758_4G011500 [Ceratodon purpureus]
MPITALRFLPVQQVTIPPITRSTGSNQRLNHRTRTSIAMPHQLPQLSRKSHCAVKDCQDKSHPKHSTIYTFQSMGKTYISAQINCIKIRSFKKIIFTTFTCNIPKHPLPLQVLEAVSTAWA